MVESIHGRALRRGAVARCLLLGALGCGVGALATAADGLTLSASMVPCPKAVCDPGITKEPDPGTGTVIVPGEGTYRVIGTRMRPDDKVPGRFGVDFDVCVGNGSRDRPVTQVLVVAAVQRDAGAARQLQSYLVKLPQPLKPGEAGCAKGAIAAPFARPLLFVAHPAN